MKNLTSEGRITPALLKTRSHKEVIEESRGRASNPSTTGNKQDNIKEPPRPTQNSKSTAASSSSSAEEPPEERLLSYSQDQLVAESDVPQLPHEGDPREGQLEDQHPPIPPTPVEGEAHSAPPPLRGLIK